MDVIALLVQLSENGGDALAMCNSQAGPEFDANKKPEGT